MAKTCNYKECPNKVFGGGFCRWHQWNRKDKQLKTFKARKPTGEREVFMEIWNSRPHVSFLSGEDLNQFEGTPFFWSLFAHVLSKAKNKYYKYKLEPKNIILITPEEHMIFDHGSEDQRIKYAKRNKFDWKPVYDLKKQLRDEYIREHGI